MDGAVCDEDMANSAASSGRDSTSCVCSSLSAPQVDQDQQNSLREDVALHHKSHILRNPAHVGSGLQDTSL